MRGLANFVAIIMQFVCLIVAASKFGIEAGFIVIAAILCNAIQVTTAPKE